MMSDMSLVAAVLLLIAVAALSGSRIVLGEQLTGDGFVAGAPRPRRLRLIDRGLAVSSALLAVAFATYLVSGVA